MKINEHARTGNALELRSAKIVGREMRLNLNLYKMHELEMYLHSDLYKKYFSQSHIYPSHH